MMKKRVVSTVAVMLWTVAGAGGAVAQDGYARSSTGVRAP
jgi:hypothetical protein